MQLRPFTTEPPPSRGCATIVDRADHALIAISLFNSYYKLQKVTDLIAWGSRTFSRYHVLIFDMPHSYTLLAKGHGPAEAVHRARKEGKKLRNRVNRIIESHGNAEAVGLVLDWADLSRNDRYLALCIEAEAAFHSDPQFRDACIGLTEKILPMIPGADAAIGPIRMLAVRYVLQEIPFLIDTAGIVGQRNSVLCYHRYEDFHEKIFTGKFKIRPNANQGYMSPVV